MNKLLKSIIFYILLTQISFAACNAWFSGIPARANFVWSPGEEIVPFTFTVNRDSPNSHCRDFYIGLSEGQSNNFSNRKLYRRLVYELSYNIYQLANPSGLIKNIPTTNPNSDLVPVHFSNNSNNNQTSITVYFYRSSLPIIATIPFGDFTDHIIMRLFEASALDMNHVLAATDIFVNLTVPKQVDISLSNSTGPIDLNSTVQNLNFGELESGKTQSINLIVASNAGYSIKLSSSNNGVLKLLTGSNKIPYTLLINGTVKNLENSSSTPIEVLTGTGMTGTNGVTNQLNFTIGAMPQNPAQGNYQDNILITATTRD